MVITELPYQLSKAGWIEKLAEQVNEGKIGGIADIRDESDRDGMRVVVELRRDANAETVLADLQRRTALQRNFGAILLALVNGQPVQLSLRRLLQEFLEYRELTLIRRTRYALKRCEDRLEVVEGLIKALNALQRVIALITAASDAASARAGLQVQFDLSERQADAVLAMPLRRLTGLEQASLRKEADNLATEQGQLRQLLDNRKLLLSTLVTELKSLRKRFATPRRTRLVEGGDALVAQRAAAVRPNAELQRQQAFAALNPDSRLLIQADGAVKIISPQVLGRLHLEEPAELAEQPAPARLILPIAAQPLLLAFTVSGRVALLRWEFAAQQPGNLERFLPESLEGEQVVQVLPLPKQGSLGLLSSDGRFKRLPVGEFQELSGRATTVLKLKEGVSLRRVVSGQEGDLLVVASSTGRMLRLLMNEANLPLMGRAAQGPMLMRLLPGEVVVVGAACAPEESASLLLASGAGQLKLLRISSLRPCQRGDMGQIGLRIQQRGDALIDLSGADRPLVGLLSDRGWSGRLELSQLTPEDCGGAGICLDLPAGQQLRELVPLINTP